MFETLAAYWNKHYYGEDLSNDQRVVWSVSKHLNWEFRPHQSNIPGKKPSESTVSENQISYNSADDIIFLGTKEYKRYR